MNEGERVCKVFVTNLAFLGWIFNPYSLSPQAHRRLTWISSVGATSNQRQMRLWHLSGRDQEVAPTEEIQVNLLCACGDRESGLKNHPKKAKVSDKNFTHPPILFNLIGFEVCDRIVKRKGG